MDDFLEKRLRQLVDKSDISEQLFRWSRGTARKDWDLVRSVFWDDARDDHGNFNGSVSEFIEWQKRHHSGVDQSVHFIGNILIEFADENNALSESYVIAFHHYLANGAHSRADIVGERAAANESEMTSVIVGRYVDKFKRVNGVWRIAHRQTVFETAKTEEAGRNLLAHWRAAQRDGTDYLHQARLEMGLRAVVGGPS
jgi:SnoaL-like domain